jgi:hypothetical protein
MAVVWQAAGVAVIPTSKEGYLTMGDGVFFELNSPVAEEYLRRNLVVAKAYGAKAGVAKALERVRQNKSSPKWLRKALMEAQSRLDGVPSEMAAYRDELKRRDDER